MPLLRADIEAVLVERTRNFLTLTGKATTVAGANAALNDSIAAGIRQAGYAVASRALVTDLDLASVSAADEEKIIDLATLRLLMSIQTNLTTNSLTTGPVSESFKADLLATILALREQLKLDYGIGLQGIEGGAIVTSTRPELDSGVD